MPPLKSIPQKKEFHNEFGVFLGKNYEFFSTALVDEQYTRKEEKEKGEKISEKIGKTIKKPFLQTRAHTDGLFCELVVKKNEIDSNCVGIGLDIEKTDRKSSDRLYSRVVSPQEEGFGLDFIDYWTIKEACYKANPKSAEQGVVPDYRIQGPLRAGVGQVSNSKSPELLFKFKIGRIHGYSFAVAKAYRRNEH